MDAANKMIPERPSHRVNGTMDLSEIVGPTGLRLRGRGRHLVQVEPGREVDSGLDEGDASRRGLNRGSGREAAMNQCYNTCDAPIVAFAFGRAIRRSAMQQEQVKTGQRRLDPVREKDHDAVLSQAKLRRVLSDWVGCEMFCT